MKSADGMGGGADGMGGNGDPGPIGWLLWEAVWCEPPAPGREFPWGVDAVRDADLPVSCDPPTL